jgi:hypothetical protein
MVSPSYISEWSISPVDDFQVPSVIMVSREPSV